MTDDNPRARAAALYGLELSYALGESDGERVDLAGVRERAAGRLAVEWASRPLELARLAIRECAGNVDRYHSPRFQRDGSVRLRLSSMLRVADDTVVAARYAREDDWLAYLAIKRANTAKITADQQATELGVGTILDDLREAGQRAQTFDVRPDLFDEDEGEAAA